MDFSSFLILELLLIDITLEGYILHILTSNKMLYPKLEEEDCCESDSEEEDCCESDSEEEYIAMIEEEEENEEEENEEEENKEEETSD